MIRFTATIEKFGQQGEKTGWSYINVPAALAEKLLPGNKKAFRVRGRLDGHPFELISLTPMGGGDFILTLKANIRKAIRKQHGATVRVEMETDARDPQPHPELIECLSDEPEIRQRFDGLTRSHRNYFVNWVNAAKTEPTRAKRIAAVLDALQKGWDFGQMVRARKPNSL